MDTVRHALWRQTFPAAKLLHDVGFAKRIQLWVQGDDCIERFDSPEWR